MTSRLYLELFYLGIIAFALLCLLVFLPFGRRIQWQRNYRQQQNIALYQQQMRQHPSPELADEFSQRLLADEQILHQQIQPKLGQSAVKNSWLFSTAVWALLFLIPLGYYFSMNRFNSVQQGEAEFKEKQHQLMAASTAEKNDDYILLIQRKLRQDPNNAEDWLELGQAYVLSNEFENALIAYANAEQISGSKPAILGLAATALYYQAGQKITPKVQQLTEAALQQDSNEVASLSLLASDYFLRTDYAKALFYWQKLLDSERQEVDRRKTIESMQLAEKLLKGQGSSQ